jgi:hypothetical protein
MIKAKVIKSFYYAKDKFIYLDEDRFKELEREGYVVKDNDASENNKYDAQDIVTAMINSNGERKVLPKQDLEER